MEDNLSENDPYKAVGESEKDSITPSFVGGKSDSPWRKDDSGRFGSGKKSAGGSRGLLSGAEKNAAKKSKSDGQFGGDALGGANAEKPGGRGLFSGAGRKGGRGLGKIGGKGKLGKNGKSGKKGKMMKYSAGAAAAGGLLMGGMLIVALGMPLFMISTIDHNLMDSLGFSDTIGVLEQQSENTTAAMLKEGEFPSEYASDLAKNGIDVGQVTAKGDFVKTNVYLADLDVEDVAGVAANGEYSVHKTGNGELTIMYDGNIITADNFVATVESNPELYVAYTEATDISSRFYYSDAVDEVYREMGVSRGNFYNWDPTGDDSQDQDQFNTMLAAMLDSDSDLGIAGCDDSDGDQCKDSKRISIRSGDDAGEKVGETADSIRDIDVDTATTKAAILLNSAISSNEPYKAAKAFIAVEEPIQRARIGDNGPVNEMMNVLSMKSPISYTDVNTGEKVTRDASILSTPNFAAAVSQSQYSRSEANNFSRDGVIIATNTADGGVIKNTTVATDSNEKSGVMLGMGSAVAASGDILQKATDRVTIAVTGSNIDMFTSVVGGNRVVEGGAFISNTINKRTLGAMPSDGSTIVTYKHKTDEILAKKAAAERAAKSPFDISSPYTFMGSIVHSIVASYIRSSVSYSDGAVFGAAVGTIAGLTGNAVNGLVGGAIADGANDSDYSTTFGDCHTVKVAANVEGDLYCNEDSTIATGYMSNNASDWQKEFPDDLENGRIKEGSDMSKFVILGMDREATVGVKSADVCESYRDLNPNAWADLVNNLGGFFGIYQSCGGVLGITSVPDQVATGAGYTMSTENSSEKDGIVYSKELVEKYSGYMLYDTVYSLLSQKQSSVSAFREEYYAKHPKDNSAAGVIARRSGMSKGEAEVAIAYANELTRIARYNPAERYAFGKPVFETAKTNDLVEHSDAVQVSLYCIWSGRTEYADVRNRSFAA